MEEKADIERVHVTPETFIKTWNSSTSFNDVVSRTGMTPAGVRGKKQQMLKLGFHLRKFDNRPSSWTKDTARVERLRLLADQTLREAMAAKTESPSPVTGGIKSIFGR